MEDFGGRGHSKSCWLPWLPNNIMQHHNNLFLVLRTLPGKSEPNLVCLPLRVFDIQPFKLLGTFEMEAIFAATVIHIAKFCLKPDCVTHDISSSGRLTYILAKFSLSLTV